MVSLATLTAGLDDEKKEPKARRSFNRTAGTPESLPLYVQYIDTDMRTFVQKYIHTYKTTYILANVHR